MFKRRSFLTSVTALTAGAWPATGVWAQQPASGTAFPNKPVKLVVPYAAGGFTDNTARILSVKLQEKWGQPVLVDNRAGASGAIGSELVAKSPPDGYTILVAIPSLLQAPILDTQLRYDLERDFARPAGDKCTRAGRLRRHAGADHESLCRSGKRRMLSPSI